MKKSKSTLTPKLRQNWWIDAALGLSAVLAVASSFYFLAFPVSGFKGGRNPYYNIVVIFNRETWDILHTWTGVAMIFAALIHVLIHWRWITGTMARSWQVIKGTRKAYGSRLTYNIALDAILAISFMICAISGLYFLFFAPRGQSSEVLLINKTTWDLIHTWSGVVMTITATLHFVLHWKWVTNITSKVFRRYSKEPIVQESTTVPASH